MEEYEKWSLLGIFSCLSPFFKVFGQVKKWLILELHEMIRVSYAVAYPFFFILLCDYGWHGGVIKFIKNSQILSIFNCCGSFSKGFGQFLAQIILSLVKIVRLCCIVACSMLFILFWDRVRDETVLKRMKDAEIY